MSISVIVLLYIINTLDQCQKTFLSIKYFCTFKNHIPTVYLLKAIFLSVSYSILKQNSAWLRHCSLRILLHWVCLALRNNSEQGPANIWLCGSSYLVKGFFKSDNEIFVKTYWINVIYKQSTINIYIWQNIRLDSVLETFPTPSRREW